MRRKAGELQVFSLSFLDLLSCALGGILLLYLALVTQNKQRAEQFAEKLEEREQRIQETAALLAKARAESASAEAMIESLRSAQNTLVGFKGDMKRVVFVFDHSGSMAMLDNMPKQFGDYQELLGSYVSGLPIEEFSVVMFGHEIQVFSESLVPATPENRERAVGFIKRFEPDGKCTETLMALKRAFAFANIDTIVLMTDGQPTQPARAGDYDSLLAVPVESVLAAVKDMNRVRQVTVNCVAMGDYFGSDDSGAVSIKLGVFLQRLSQENGGGSFIGQ